MVQRGPGSEEPTPREPPGHLPDRAQPDQGPHPVFTDEEAFARYQVARRRWEPMWPLGVASTAAGRIGRHWSAERRTIIVGLVAFTLAALAGLAAGLVLASLTGTLERFPGFILLVPAAIGVRGAIFGAMGSRLGSALRLGTFEARLASGGVLRENVISVSLLTLFVSALTGVLAYGFNIGLGRPMMSVWDFLTISVVGGVATSIVVGAATLGVTWLAVRFDWDLDSVASPFITLTGDVVGIPMLAAAALLAGRDQTTFVVGLVCLLAGVAASVRGVWRGRGPVRRIVIESLPTLTIVVVLTLVAGAVLEEQLDTLIRFGVFLIVLPAFLGAAGGLGSVFVSRLGSKIHLGTVEARLLPDATAILDSTLVYLIGIVVFPIMAALAALIAFVAGQSSPGLYSVVEATLVGGAIASTVALFVGYYTALVSVRFGLDPDNHGIPAVTSTMDLFGVLALTAAMALVGVT